MMSNSFEPDHREPQSDKPSQPDWDTLAPTYEAPGARDVVPILRKMRSPPTDDAALTDREEDE